MTDVIYKPPYEAQDKIIALPTSYLSWQDFLLLYGQPRNFDLYASGNHATYDLPVPAGKIWFMIQSSLRVYLTAGTTGEYGDAWLGSTISGYNSWYLACTGSYSGNSQNIRNFHSVATGFAMPVKLRPGDKLTLYNATGTTIISDGYITVIEVDEALFNQFFNRKI